MKDTGEPEVGDVVTNAVGEEIGTVDAIHHGEGDNWHVVLSVEVDGEKPSADGKTAPEPIKYTEKSNRTVKTVREPSTWDGETEIVGRRTGDLALA